MPFYIAARTLRRTLQRCRISPRGRTYGLRGPGPLSLDPAGVSDDSRVGLTQASLDEAAPPLCVPTSWSSDFVASPPQHGVPIELVASYRIRSPTEHGRKLVWPVAYGLLQTVVGVVHAASRRRIPGPTFEAPSWLMRTPPLYLSVQEMIWPTRPTLEELPEMLMLSEGMYWTPWSTNRRLPRPSPSDCPSRYRGPALARVEQLAHCS